MSRSLRYLAALASLGACGGAPARRAGAPPDLLLVVIEGEAPAVESPGAAEPFVEAEVIHTDPAATWRALLTGQWPGTAQVAVPNTLHGVLQLYGYTAYAGESDLLRAVLSAEPALGAPPKALPAGCPGAFLGGGIDALDRGPQADPLLVIVPLRVDPACGGEEGLRAALAAAARWAVEPERALVVVGLQGGAAGAPLEPAPARPPLWLVGFGEEPAPRPGLCSALDVMPTLLTAGQAVVPSDAAGQPLQHLRRRGPAGAPAALIQQAPDGARAALTRAHRLIVPAGAAPGEGGGPPAAARLELRPPPPAAKAPPGGRAGAEAASADPERAKAALWSALLAWERSVGSAHPDERVGADALRKVLAEQGYFQ
ncbi:MAG: hypothetical protein JNM72_18995 [Deltaproteobacteria bacterium]|nr:hypothetical protein [Deltaproteobacteria bacterium]